MNLGFDIDGTITKYPDFFIQLGRAWKSFGYKVYIITGLGDDGLAKRLSKWPYLSDTSFYDEIITTSLYNSEERSLIGKTESNEDVVGRFKQRICKEKNIAIMFDDMASIHRKYGDVPIFEVK
jgi:hypothetical protein